MIFNSIRWRLQAWHGLILTVIVVAFSVTAYQLQYAQRLRRVDNELQELTSQLTAFVRPASEPPGLRPPGHSPLGPGHDGPDDGGPDRDNFDRGGPPGPGAFGPRNGAEFDEPPARRRRPDEPERVSPPAAALFNDSETNRYYYAVWTADGSLQKKSTNAPTDLSLPERIGSGQRQSARQRGIMREVFRFTSTDRCVLVGRSIQSDLDELHRAGWWLAAAAAAVLALGLAGGWWVATRAIKPIAAISNAASQIAEGDLSRRIDVANTKSELGELAGVLNSTFARLDSSFARQKQFTADAAHELRTPIAVLISEAQTALARKRTAEEYQETIEACLETAQQMRQLTESLLELARLDAGQESGERERVDLAENVRACIAQIHPLADERGIRIHATLSSANAFGNPIQLNQVITNLLANAIHYNRTNGEIRISTSNGNGNTVLAVADSGPGIAAEDLPHIFDRFYRADKARSRTKGRTGLGLAICKAIVTAHGGTIKVHSVVGSGSKFTVTLPVANT